MKKIFFASLITIIIFTACQNTGRPITDQPASSTTDDSYLEFTVIEGREWVLIELRSQREIIILDRQRLDADGMPGIYTIHFQSGKISGMGSPNRFFGSYALSAGRSLDISDIASTMMFSFLQPEGLTESAYFDFLSRTTGWDIYGRRLELYSSSADGMEYVLVFVSE